jgi:hypothetical protein
MGHECGVLFRRYYPALLTMWLEFVFFKVRLTVWAEIESTTCKRTSSSANPASAGQRPAVMPIGWLATSYGDQARLTLAIEFTLPGRTCLFLPSQSSPEPMQHHATPHMLYRTHMASKSICNASVDPSRSILVSLQEDISMFDLICRRFSFGDQSLQLFPFRLSESHDVLLHHYFPPPK